jgi:hypothetical protein
MTYETHFEPGEPVYCVNVSGCFITYGTIIGHHPKWDNDWEIDGKYNCWPYRYLKDNAHNVYAYTDFWIFRDLKDALQTMQEHKKLDNHKMLILSFEKLSNYYLI